MNSIAMHDQALAFIQKESFNTEVDGGISFEILAHQFENYWRQRIARELDFLTESDTKTAAIAIAAKGIPGGLI